MNDLMTNFAGDCLEMLTGGNATCLASGLHKTCSHFLRVSDERLNTCIVKQRRSEFLHGIPLRCD